MGYLLLGALVVGGAWYYAILRGRLTVRAYMYLCFLADGQSEGDANRLVHGIDILAASRLQDSAKRYADNVFGGSQLSMISTARLQGFTS